ncbi:MAG TPA: fatty acid desaturase [Rhodocyclaceae bacterium]|nr:fatty acid desaturase [Rhodocyclaceae bacterium]
MFDLPWWVGLVFVLLSTHITIVAVTIYLHRMQAHHALDLHPLISHFFRAWLWLSTGMVTREWVAIHRKHHAKCESAADPHSPQIQGIRRVLLEGSELYRREAKNEATRARYGHGTPDDWIERHLYSRHPTTGIGLLLLADLACFGAIGLTLWAIQMLWIPLFAAGVINGIGHYWGYRSFTTRDASRNIVPWGILIGGEELHNNHHAYSRSARLSNPNLWWEFDIGWLYIRLLALSGLATVHCSAPRLNLRSSGQGCDMRMLEAVITHRFEVLSNFSRTLRRTALAEAGALQLRVPELPPGKLLAALRHWLQRERAELTNAEASALALALQSSTVLHTLYAMRRELVSLWSRSTATQEQSLRQLDDWCRAAESSGIAALKEFSRKLRCYG